MTSVEYFYNTGVMGIELHAKKNCLFTISCKSVCIEFDENNSGGCAKVPMEVGMEGRQHE